MITTFEIAKITTHFKLIFNDLNIDSIDTTIINTKGMSAGYKAIEDNTSPSSNFTTER